MGRIVEIVAQGARAFAEGTACPHAANSNEIGHWYGGYAQAQRAQQLIAEGLDLSHVGMFVVGHSKDGSFWTLGHRSSFDGRSFLASYGKRCDCIHRVEDFDPHAWRHSDLVPFYAAAVRKMAEAAARSSS